MTFPAVLLPLVTALLVALVVTAVHRRLPPALASRVVTTTIVIVVAAAVPTFWILSLAFLTHLPLVGPAFGWCAAAMGVHHAEIPLWVGVPSVVVSLGGLPKLARTVRTFRNLCENGRGGVKVACNPQPFAFTLPGRAGQIVVSTGLLALLDEDEQEVVLAHERAHARHRHDRYLLTARLGITAMPVLRPLVRRLQFSLERWADESAVAECGDRSFVARTLGKVALHGAHPVGALGFTGLGVTARVGALLAPPVASPRPPTMVLIWISLTAAGLLAAVQLHHLVTLVTALCPG